MLGVGKKVFCILDGDIEAKVPKQYNSTKKLFLPVNSVEKYLKNILIDKPNPTIRKAINDSLFTLKSLDSLITDCNHTEHETAAALNEKYKEDNDGKRLYAVLLKDLKSRNITEESFINTLYIIIKQNVDFSHFNEMLIKATT